MTTLPLAIPRPVHPTGIWSWITTIDHKRIGVLYGVTAFLMFFSGGIEAFLIRIQLARPEQNLITPEIFNQLFTMHATTMIFLGVMPLSAAFFNFVIPLQIGARDVAFPRLNAFSYWTFLAGALLLKISWFTHSAPNGGWFGYSPLTGITYNLGHGIDVWILSLQILGIASLAASFNFIVTILNMRAPGMGLMRMPLFTWMTLVTAILLVLAFPVITVALIELYFDRSFGMNFFNVAAGANPVLWQHLFWVFGHPEVYILILPAMGIVSEILPVFSKKPLFGYATVVLAGVIIAFMGWMVWSHHMFTVGLGPGRQLSLHGNYHDDSGANGYQGVQLDGDDVGRLTELEDTDAVLDWIRLNVRHRRNQRSHARGRRVRRPTAGYLLHRGPYPLRAVRRLHIRDSGGRVLLVPQVDGSYV